MAFVTKQANPVLGLLERPRKTATHSSTGWTSLTGRWRSRRVLRGSWWRLQAGHRLRTTRKSVRQPLFASVFRHNRPGLAPAEEEIEIEGESYEKTSGYTSRLEEMRSW